MNLRTRLRRMARELAKFGSVGAISFVITFAAFNVFHTGLGLGPMTSTTLATVIATTFAYFANRYWTFRHRERSGLGREYMLFFAFNGIGLVITQVFIGFGYYVLDQRTAIASNLALIVGTGAATVFRFWSYRKWVFMAPEPAVRTVQEGRPPAERPAPDPPFPAGQAVPDVPAPGRHRTARAGSPVRPGR
ncbi:GtrA family protein [Actinocorallia populi]|uniref:GtrA family protein n=1 Tax=Actinocorallia populi TaxID=2079200 RepID=UPI001E51CF46|nr:GtrA family protein [Actinocorallia populi]